MWREIGRRSGRVTGGLVLTHLGITPGIMAINFARRRAMLHHYGPCLVAFNCGLLAPLPGSAAFRYLSSQRRRRRAPRLWD